MLQQAARGRSPRAVIPPSRKPARKSRRWWGLAIPVVLLLAAGGYFLMPSGRGSPAAAKAEPKSAPKPAAAKTPDPPPTPRADANASAMGANPADKAGDPPAGAVALSKSGDPPQPPPQPPAVEIGIAYGTEKRTWLEWAVQEFGTTEEGKRIRIKLIPMGSLEGAHAIVDGDKTIHVWSPASSLYRETFVRDWKARQQGTNPIARAENLALTPMAIVMWQERYDAFTARCPEVSLRTIKFALEAKTGWEHIAGRTSGGISSSGTPTRTNRTRA